MMFSNEAMRRAFAAALFIAFPFGLSVSPSMAALLEGNDSFFVGTGGYTTGNLTGQGPSVNGFSGNWITDGGSAANAQVLSSGLSYGDPLYAAASGGAVQLSSNNEGQAFRRNLSSSVTQSTAGTLYMSLLMQRPSSEENVGFQVLSLFNGSDRDFYIGTRAGEANFSFFANRNGSGSTIYSLDSTNTDVNLFVVKFEFAASGSSSTNNDTVTVWLNPDLSNGPDPTGGVQVTERNIRFNRLVLQHGGVGGQLTTTFDEIRFGDSWADVTTIPEPASASLLGTALLLGLLRRRHR